MKKSILASLFLLSVSFLSFNLKTTDKSDLLIKKWKPTTIVVGERSQSDIPENASLEFKKDNSYFLDEREQGTWELSKDNKNLSFKGGEFGPKDSFDGKWEIVKLTESELELSTVFTGLELAGAKDPKVIVKLTAL